MLLMDQFQIHHHHQFQQRQLRLGYLKLHQYRVKVSNQVQATSWIEPGVSGQHVKQHHLGMRIA